MASRRAPVKKGKGKTTRVSETPAAEPLSASALRDALERAEAAAAAAQEAAERWQERVEEAEEEEEDAPDQPTAYYNPLTHTAISSADLALLLRAKADNDRAAEELKRDTARQQEAMFSGYSHQHEQYRVTRDRDIEYIASLREDADRQRERVAQLQMENANMVRQSEDAKLERDRMSADIQRMQLANERLQIEMEGRLRERDSMYRALAQLGSPTAAALGQALGTFVSGKFGIPGLPGMSGASPVAGGPQGLPGTPGATPPGAPAGAPRSRVNFDFTEDFANTFNDVWNACGPESRAYFRAFFASHLLASQGAPPVTENFLRELVDLVIRDAGMERASAFFLACAPAYTSVEAPQGAPVAAPPSSAAVN